MSMYHDEASPEESNNRTFLIAVGILGGIVLISIACLAGYVLSILPQQNAAGETQSAIETQNSGNINEALTATAVSFDLSQTPQVTFTPYPTDTPLVAQPSATNTLEFTHTPEPYTATVAAGLTQVAASTSTVVFTSTALPPTSTLAIAEPTETLIETPNPATATVSAAFTQLASSTQTIIPTSTALPYTGGGGDENTPTPTLPSTGQVEITYPLEMIVDEDDTVTVQIKFNIELATVDYHPVPGTAEISLAPSSQNKERGSLVTPVMLYPIMSVELVSPKFDIIGDISNNERTISKSQPAVWTWSIRARESGTQTITIKISGKTDFGNGISTFLVKSQSINVTVLEKPVLTRIFDYLAKNWLVILGTGGPLAWVFSILINWRAKRKNEKENEIGNNVPVLEKPVLPKNFDNLPKNWIIVLGTGGFLALLLSYLIYWRAKNENELLRNKIGDLEKRMKRLRKTGR